MENNISILTLMVEHHTLIEVYLQVVKDNLSKGSKEALPAFENFKWQLEKHFFLEEKSIFVSYQADNSKIISLIVQVVKEHKEILELVENIRSSLNKNEGVSIDELHNRLTDHRILEERDLYPLLDKEFTPYQKEAILKKIDDIVLQSTY